VTRLVDFRRSLFQFSTCAILCLYTTIKFENDMTIPLLITARLFFSFMSPNKCDFGALTFKSKIDKAGCISYFQIISNMIFTHLFLDVQALTVTRAAVRCPLHYVVTYCSRLKMFIIMYTRQQRDRQTDKQRCNTQSGLPP